MRLRSAYPAPILALSLALAGCSDEAASNANPSGGASNANPPPECTTMVHDGTSHSMGLALNPPPLPMGGVIAEGDYVMTAARMFNVPPSVSLKRNLGGTLRVSGAKLEQVLHVDGAPSSSTWAFSTAGTKLSLTDKCTGAAPLSYDYTATPTLLEIYVPEPGTPYVIEQVFTKR